MYRNSEVITALLGRIGFREPIQTKYQGILDAANKTSRSGEYYDDAHAVVTVGNIKEVVIQQPNATNEDVNTFLQDMQKACILKVLDAVFGEPDIIEQQMEFGYCDRQPQPITNAGLFVGRRIRVAPNASRSIQVKALTLYFDGVQTFDVHLFNSAKKAPLQSKEVTTEADSQVIFPLDWIMNYMDSATKSGVFFIGYFQDDLGSVKAYDEQPAAWNRGLLYGSDGIEADQITGQPDFVRHDPRITSRTYGLNFEICGVKDWTEVIVRNQQAFDKAIGLQMAAIITEAIIHTIRSNDTQRISQEAVQRLYNDLNLDMATPEMPYSSGLKNQLRRELVRLHKNFFPNDKPTSTTVSECYTQRFPL